MPKPRWISRQKIGCRKKSIQASQVLTEPYRREHPEELGLAPRAATAEDP